MTGSICALAAAASLVACAPEPMTVPQACSAEKNLARNTPDGEGSAAEVEVIRAKYRVAYYRDWSGRIDGALGAAFSDLAKAEAMTISEGSSPEGDSSDEYWSLMLSATKTIMRICG